MYTKRVALEGAVTVLVLTAAIAASSAQGEGEQVQPTKSAVATGETAATDVQSEDVGITVTAVNGSLSAFWGRTTQYTGDIWVIENEAGITVVVQTKDGLNAYFGDGREPVFAIVEGGKPGDFMDILLEASITAVAGGETCGECTDQACCNKHCPEESWQWCICTANVTCADQGGVCQVHFGAGKCTFTCCDR